MTDDSYSVRINRRDGIVEITGADKDWIAEQMEKLSVVYTDPPHEPAQAAPALAKQDEAETRSRRSTRPRKSAATGTQDKSQSAIHEKLTADAQKRLEEFMAERKARVTSKQDQAAVIAFFLEEELAFEEGIDQHELAAVYDIMGWRAPVNPRAVINNARSRNNYFRGWVSGRTKLSVTGRNFVRHDAVQPPDPEQP